MASADLPKTGADGAYVNGGNSFGAAATLGTNDSNTLGFKTNNSTRVTIDTSGNVGIGTTSPGTAMDVAGTITSRPSGTGAGQTGQLVLRELAANGTHTVTLKAPDAVTADRTLIFPDSNGTSGQALTTDGSGNLSWTTISGGGGGSQSSATGFTLNSNSDGSGTDGGFTFQSNGSTLMSIDNSGNTTITGNTTISGSSTFTSGTGAVALNGATTVAANKDLAMSSGTGQFSQTYSGTGPAAAITDTAAASGNILNLTTTSTAAASGDKALSVAVSGANASSTVTRYGVHSAVTSTGTSSTNVGGYFSASGASNNYGLLVSNGYVGIGTTSPSSNLSFSGTSAQTIGMERSSSNTGNNLTISAGGAQASSSNKAGGDLIFASGTNTGQPTTPSRIEFHVPPWNSGAATSDSAPTAMMAVTRVGVGMGGNFSGIANAGLHVAEQNNWSTSGDAVIENDFDAATPGAGISLFSTRNGGVTQSGDTVGNYLTRIQDSTWTDINPSNIKTVVTNATHNSVQSTLSLQTMVSSTLADRITIKGADVGIGTTSPSSALEVRGEIKATDSTGASRLWGQGRPGSVRYGTLGAESGLCTNGSISFGLSFVATTWEGSAAACPSGTWVCTATERGTGACDTARPDGTIDRYTFAGASQNDGSSTHYGWLADVGSTSTAG